MCRSENVVLRMRCVVAAIADGNPGWTPPFTQSEPGYLVHFLYPGSTTISGNGGVCHTHIYDKTDKGKHSNMLHSQVLTYRDSCQYLKCVEP